MMTKKRVIQIIVFFTFVILLWDCFLYTDSVDRNSITQIVIDYSKQYPIIAFLLGFLMGHFYA